MAAKRRTPAASQGLLPGMEEQPSPPPAAEPVAETPVPEIAPPPLSAEATPDLTGKSVYVVDAFSLIFQVFHALPPMTSPKGAPVAAVFGFTRDILYLLEEKKPDYLFVAFDVSGPTYREQMFSDYKMHRTEMPVDLVAQLPNIRRVLAAIGVPALECAGFEADDILATLAKQTGDHGGQCCMVTADKDCRQLLNERVCLYNVRKNLIFDVAALQADWGIRPDQVVDYQALVGDAVDNIPGVPGIGGKTAQKLLNEYDTLDALLDRAGEIKQNKLRENLLASREIAMISRDLARLEVNTPVAIPWSAGATSNLHPSRAAPLFREFGFRTLATKWGAAAGEQMLMTEPAMPFTTLGNLDEVLGCVEKLKSAAEVTVHCVLTQPQPRWAEIAGLAIIAGQDACYFPFLGPNSDTVLDPLETLSALQPLFSAEQILKHGHDLKRVVVALLARGIQVEGLGLDTMIAGYLLDAGERGHSLPELAKRHLNVAAPTAPWEATGGPATLLETPLVEVARYAVDCAALAARLRPILQTRLTEDGLDQLYADVERPLIGILADMEYIGVKIDTDRLKELSWNYGQKMLALEQEIYQLAGHEFNIASPKQLAQVLFEELQLPVLKKTKTGASTDAEVLEELALQHTLPARIIDYRQYAKLKNTYVDALPALVHPLTKRVHATFHQAVAATGRLSSSDPNLQNIPVRSEAGREIRSAFLPEHEGWVLLAADYSQIELRVLAHYSQDAALLSAFAADEDIHTRVASQVFRVPAENVTSDQRRAAKAVNFGIIYGQSPFGLAKALGITQDEAAQFIEAYFANYPGVDRFFGQILADSHKIGYIKTILGRRRAIAGVRDPNLTGTTRNRNLPEREAINSVIQGSAADLIKLAMIRIHRRLRQERWSAKLLLQIHDELIFETPTDELTRLGGLVQAEMAAVLPLSVTLKVDLKSGRNWSDCEPW